MLRLSRRPSSGEAVLPSGPSGDQMEWWGPTEIGDGDAVSWGIGACSLWLGRRGQEVMVGMGETHDPMDTRFERTDGPSRPPGGLKLRRYVTPGDEPLHLVPRPPDRPVVARPETPFTILPGARVTAFVTTPVWIEAKAGHVLFDLPSIRPSDTWFGTSPREGDLCYAIRSLLRLKQDTLVRAPHRATTVVRITNTGGDPLLLERVRLPLPECSLYVDGSGMLWTAAVEMVRSAGNDASVRVVTGGPDEAGPTRLVSAGRIQAQSHPVFRVFNSFID